MDDFIKYVGFAASVASFIVSCVTLYQLRLFVGKELSKGLKKLTD